MLSILIIVLIAAAFKMLLSLVCFAGLLAVAYWYKLYTTREIISDADGQPYLIRYFIHKPKSKKRGRIYLHHILRSDHDRALHDHPWSFTSFILLGGYTEVADASPSVNLRHLMTINEIRDVYAPTDKESVEPFVLYSKTWFGPLSLLRRPADWRHRLVLPEGKTAWTLVKTSPKLRSWGFWPNGKFCHWKKYDTGTGMCDE